MADFGCQSFSRFTQSFSQFIRDVNGEKTSRYLMIFSRLVFHSLPPLEFGLVVLTVWIGSEYVFVILLDESASKSHTQKSTRAAP